MRWLPFPQVGRKTLISLYYVHYNLAHRSGQNSADAHQAGLRGALCACYQKGIFGNPPPRNDSLRAELAPFLLMDREESIEALAEYVLWRQRSTAAKKDWLADKINKALAVTITEVPLRSLASLGFMNNARWCKLLYAGTRIALFREAGQLSRERTGMTPA